MCTGNLRNKLTTNPRNRRDKVIQTMQEHDPSLYKEIIRYLKDGNSVSYLYNEDYYEVK